MAARIPAVRKPPRIGPVMSLTILASTALGGKCGGMTSRPSNCRCRGPHAYEHAGHPHDHDEDGMGHHRQLKAVGAARRQPVLEQVGEHTHRQRHKQIRKELEFAGSGAILPAPMWLHDKRQELSCATICAGRQACRRRAARGGYRSCCRNAPSATFCHAEERSNFDSGSGSPLSSITLAPSGTTRSSWSSNARCFSSALSVKSLFLAE